ncbi:hypothetical protein THERMOT_141 [Bathymodiolus thermophilus thioautotrophic gill symbiont]|nr:hypothetical protein THERMOT_141 [Bathymodiolus thermophilus thioautotrophic gill symbiont]
MIIHIYAKASNMLINLANFLPPFLLKRFGANAILHATGKGLCLCKYLV